MTTPFDDVIRAIQERGFHNHRTQDHSDRVSIGVPDDLRSQCEPLEHDFAAETIGFWLNVKTPGARQRKVDLLVGEKSSSDGPDLARLRICLENKSVITAHRNRDARFDDLNEALQVLHNVKSEAVLVATVIIGVAEKVLNVPDKIKPRYRTDIETFERRVVPRLSVGDQTLWQEFDWAVSRNRAGDAAKTVEKFRRLPTRAAGHTHVVGYDYVLLVPAWIDNVNRPRVARRNGLGIDVDADYQDMLQSVCKAYRARWHM